MTDPLKQPSSPEARAARLQERARQLWEEDGRPAAGPQAYEEEAAQLLAIEAAPHAGTVPLQESRHAAVEPLEALENQGEFPTLTDQGEDRPGPLRREDRLRQSDED